MHYLFDWDFAKETQNIRKHRVNFRRAATVFHDPDQLSLYDDEHSEIEDRWITLGIDSSDILRVVIHTFEQIEEDLYRIRIISARKASPNEAKMYTDRIRK